MTVQDWLGKDNQLGIDIWEKKYRNGEETFEQWLDRVSNGNKPLRQLIMDKKFLFGGRTLSNRGVAKSGTYFNCYSLGYIEDDYKQILQAAMDMGLTYKAQGGQGVSLTKIRPLGTPIGTRYKSDGIVPFMRLYNSVTTETSQGGARKGALMISLDIRHKEAETFITLKNQSGVVEKANLSLEIDDDFMRAVKAYYDTGQEIVLHEIRDYGVHHIEYDIIPIKLYKLLVQNCYDWGDPACLFTNKFRNYNLMEFDDDYQVETSNPCVTGDTLILTENGYRPIEKLDGIPCSIWNGYMFSNVTPIKTAKEQHILSIKFSNGCELKCTRYHKFILKNGERIEAKDLKINDKLVRCNFPVINGTRELRNPYTQGFFSGDGFICADRKAKYISLYGDKKKALSKYLSTISQRENSEDRETYNVEVDFDKTFVPMYNYRLSDKLEWLSGLVDSDGGNNLDGSISISSIEQGFLNLVRLMLNTMGIDCTVSKTKDGGTKTIKGRECLVKPLFKITIASSDIQTLNEYGFNTHRVSNSVNPNRIAKRFIKVSEITELDELEDVYCFTEEHNHSGIFNGVITAQCGEQPLPRNFCCNLGSLNLSSFVKNPFTEDVAFNIKDFLSAVEIAVGALDELVDENADNHPLEAQKINSLNYRNIGLGITGYGTTLMKMGIKYGSNRAKEFTDFFMSAMFLKAVRSSSRLAAQKGSFPKYKDVLFNSTIIEKHFDKDEVEELKSSGIRNCSLLSFAPAGTLSLLFNVTSGIEPEFSISYKRKTESLIENEPSYYDVYCNAYTEYKETTGRDDMPDYFITAQDVPWRDRIDIQSIMQQHIDTAISSTINLKEDAKIEDVEKLYLYAWEQGLKGITIFRDGCKRLGILTTEDKTENPKEPQKEELGRGFILDISNDVVGKKRKLMTGCGSLHCVAFFDPRTGDLLETYLSKGSTGGCQNFMVGLSRMISLSARAGCDINSIVNQLDSCGVCPSYSVRSATKHDTSKGSCCPMAIGNALIEMHNEMLDEISVVEREDDYNLYDSLMTGLNEAIEIETISKDVCPDCGEPLIFEGGCNTCKNCGWSKCT